MFTDDVHHLVTINNITIFINSDETVTVTIKGKTDSWASFFNQGLQLLWVCRTNTSIDVKAIRLVTNDSDFCVQIKENITCRYRSRTISRIQGNLHTTKVNTCSYQEFFIFTKTFWIIHKGSKSFSWRAWKRIFCSIEKGFNFRFTRIIQFKAITTKELDAIIKSWIMAGWNHNTGTCIFCTNQIWDTRCCKYSKFVDFNTHWEQTCY